jgi:hypothetical protein
MSRNHPLFTQFPLNGSALTSAGRVSTPYHVYDGYGVFIGGTADLAATRELLRMEEVAPIATRDGRTPMGIWICNFTEASLGPHHELQFSFFADDRSLIRVKSHPFGLLAHMTSPRARMICHGLWNNTQNAVAYNRELLTLNSRLAQSHIQFEQGDLTFTFWDERNRQPVLSGTLFDLDKASLRASWNVMRQVGFRHSLALARRPWMNLQILNPVGVCLNRNAAAQSFTKNDLNRVRYFTEQTDTLEFGHTPYSRLNFRPQFVQYMKGFKFVYLQPEEMEVEQAALAS